MLEASEHTRNDGTNYFGKSLAISGNHVIIGAYNNDAAYISQRDSNGNWGNSGGGSYDGGNINARTETQKLLSSDGTSGDMFGISIAISGNYAIVGAPYNNSHRGAAYIFENNQGLWTQTTKIVDSNGVEKLNTIDGD